MKINRIPILPLFLLPVFFTFCNNKQNKKVLPFQIRTKVDTIKKEIVDSPAPIMILKEPKTIFQKIDYDTSKKYIYLTFDDGPQNGTVACFDLCKKLEIKSTFFMVGVHASSPNLRNIVKEIRDDYPRTLLANHSSTHAYNKYHSFYHNYKSATNDFYLAQNTLKVPLNIIRLPGSNSWVTENRIKAESLTKPVCNLLDSANYNVIGWDLEWHFNQHNSTPIQSVDKMVSTVYETLNKNKMYSKNSLVILMHDRMFKHANYTDSLHKFISTLKQDSSLIFETVDHYPGLKK